MVWKPVLVASAVIVVMSFSSAGISSAFSFDRKFGSGMSRRSPATTSNVASSGSASASPSRRPARMASTASSSRSIRSRSAMVLDHLCPQRLQAPPLKLLDRSLAPADCRSDLADAPLYAEPHHQHAPLIARKPVDEPEERCPALDVLDLVRRGITHRVAALLLSRRPREVIGDCVCGDAIKPGRERHAAPLELLHIHQRLMKNLRGHVLGDGTIANAADHEPPHPPEVLLVQLREPARVLLCRLDQQPLVSLVRGIHESLIKPPRGPKVTVAVIIAVHEGADID